MASKKSRKVGKKKRAGRRRKHVSSGSTLGALHRHADVTKAFLKRKGHKWNFYDYLDSYTDEYRNLAHRAPERFKSLAGIHQCNDDNFFGLLDSLLELNGYGDWEKIGFVASDVTMEYGVGDEPVPESIAGQTVALRDTDGVLRTVIFLRREIENAQSPEMADAIRIPLLLHELGHVDDWERGLHLYEGDVRLIDAEAHAHEFALRECLDNDYIESLKSYLQGLEKYRTGEAHEIAIYKALTQTEIFDRCRNLRPGWIEIIKTLTPTPEDVQALPGLVHLGK